MKIRVLQINTVFNTGSTGRIVNDLGNSIISSGNESYIIYGRGEKVKPINKKNNYRVNNLFNNIIHGLLTRIFDIHGLGSICSTIKLINFIKKVNPDLIHLHNIHGYYLNYKILFKYLSKTKVPIVWTLHDCWTMTGHCTHFDYVGCLKWETGCYKCPQKTIYPSSYLFDMSKYNYNQKNNTFNLVENLTIIPVSEWLSRIVKRSYLSSYPIRIIENGVDINLFKPIEDTSKIKNKLNLQNKFIILGVANVWNKRKGFYDFLQLSKQIDSETIIILVGLTLKQMKMLPVNIIGIQRTDSINDLVDLYSCSDLYINTSYEETFGLTTVEAMACGTPVVVYNSTASPELINDNVGFVVSKGNINELLEVILSVKKTGKSKFSMKCRREALLKYNKENSEKKYLDLYKSLLKNIQ